MAKNKNIKVDSIFYQIKQLLKDKWYFVVGIIPFILGVIGFYIQTNMDGEKFIFVDAAYKSIRFYVLEVDDNWDQNIFLEIARWTAPVVTISGIAAILGNLVKHFKNRFLYRWWSFLNFFKKLFKVGRPFVTIALYGEDNYESKTLKKHLIKYNETIIVKVIEMHEHIPRADLYILFSDDDDNFDFYNKHINKLEKYCRLNSRKEKNRLLSRDLVREDFKRQPKNSSHIVPSLKQDNKYIIMKTQKYSIKDEISDYITLVNMQELGSFKFWHYRWNGIFYNKDTYLNELIKITYNLIETLYKNKILSKDIDPSFIKDYVDYFGISSSFLNYLININKDYVNYLCDELNKNVKDIKQSLRFNFIKKLFKIDNTYLEKFSKKICDDVINNIKHTKCITSDNPNNLTISIIGDNEMAEHLIFTALQLNIFNLDQKFTYNLFGDWDSFICKHEQLVNSDYSDNIVSCSSNIEENKQALEDSDVIIVCDVSNPNKIVDYILMTAKNKQIDLISTKQDLYLKYKSNEFVNFYNYINKTSNFEDFVEDNLNIDNIRKAYAHDHENSVNQEEWNIFVKQWNYENSLFRYNYICQEEFLEIMNEYSDNVDLHEKLNDIRRIRFNDFYNLECDEDS